MRFELSVNILTNHAVKKKEITVFGGDQLRPNLHIEDYCDAVLCLIESESNKIKNQIFNVGYENLAIIDIAAMETQPIARRFEVYGSEGSAIMEPFEPADSIRLSINKSNKNYNKGINIIKIKDKKRYDEPFQIFLDRLKKNNKPEFDINHELLVQESLMRAING